MSRINEIVKIAESIDGSTKSVTLKIAAWPYSRAIIKGICENNMIDLKVNRLSKDHEEFVLKAASDAPEKLKKIMSLVNKEAKENVIAAPKSDKLKMTSERNVIAEQIRKKFGLKPEVKEVKEKPVKVAKEKKAAKKPAAKIVKADKKVIPMKKAEKPKATLAEKKAAKAKGYNFG